MEEDKVGPLVDVGGTNAAVVDEAEGRFVEAQVVDDVGHDETIRSGHIVEIGKIINQVKGVQVRFEPDIVLHCEISRDGFLQLLWHRRFCQRHLPSARQN